MQHRQLLWPDAQLGPLGGQVMNSGIPRFLRLTMVTVVLLATAGGCGSPNTKHVTEVFLKENPTYTVISVSPGEGDSDHVYIHIRYRRSDTPAECEVVWAYRSAQPEWELFAKGEPGLAGTLCEGCSRKPCV
jgi:hypothetical protein